MESGRWMNFFCHSMQRQEDSPPATDCRLGDGPCISTCALLVESDGGGRKTWRYIMEFQSTLSSRRATVRGSMRTLEFTRFQSTLSSRRATVGPKNALQTLVISIHALLTESDGSCSAIGISLRVISIHALLTESDPSPGSSPGPPPNFNPRSPHGERHFFVLFADTIAVFQSTLSSRRATTSVPGCITPQIFQSTLSSRRATSA